MSDNLTTMIGNVADSPRRVRLENGSVTNFRMACTKRRWDREKEEYVDANTFWVDVECWGELGGNVSQSISKGDPVIVRGELYTRHWETEHGRRSAPQIKAAAVGPNLTRGVAEFRRSQRSGAPAAGAVPVPAEGSAEGSAELPDEDRFDGEELATGQDYNGDLSTLHETDSDSPLLKPALH